MIKLIKIGNLVYQNIEPKTIDQNGNEVWNIPNDPTQLKTCILDTLGWIVGQNITKIIGSVNKKDASTTKAIVLLAKIIKSLNPDTSILTTNEQNAFNSLLTLADNGYSDSELLNDALTAIQDQLAWYNQKVDELNQIDLTADTALDDLINFLENL
jgi:hypothetical protein